MRIDAASGSGAWQVGFFSGSFKGNVDGLSGSLEELSSSLGEISSSIDEHIIDISGSTLEYITGVSSSIDSNIQSISRSLVSGTLALSSSVDTEIRLVSGNIVSDMLEISGNINTTIQTVSESFSSSLLAAEEHASSSLAGVSSSIVSRMLEISGNIVSDMLAISGDLSNTDIADSESAAYDRDLIRQTYVSNSVFYDYTSSVDETYYKSGSVANFTGLSVSGSTQLKGDLYVSGTVITVHSEDVTIKDKFVEIASGSTSPEEADGAGFGIQGADVSMSYNAAEDILIINKDIRTNVLGTASYAGLASDVLEDGIIARALVDLYHLIILQTGSLEEAAEIFLNCSSVRTYQTCEISTVAAIQLSLPDTKIDSVDHFILFRNTSAQDCIITLPAGSLYPSSAPGTVPGTVTCSAGGTLSMSYLIVGDDLVFTNISEMVLTS